mgnify:CR=1 FL=1
MMPLAISKWKLNTSLEAKLNYRSISLRNIRERAKFRIQEGLTRAFRDFLYSQEFTEIHTPKIGAKVQKVVQTYLSWNISTARQCSSKVLSSTNR